MASRNGNYVEVPLFTAHNFQAHNARDAQFHLGEAAACSLDISPAAWGKQPSHGFLIKNRLVLSFIRISSHSWWVVPQKRLDSPENNWISFERSGGRPNRSCLKRKDMYMYNIQTVPGNKFASKLLKTACCLRGSRAKPRAERLELFAESPFNLLRWRLFFLKELTRSATVLFAFAQLLCLCSQCLPMLHRTFLFRTSWSLSAEVVNTFFLYIHRSCWRSPLFLSDYPFSCISL